jgi:hypothetical protein
MTTQPRSGVPSSDKPADHKALLAFSWFFVGIPLAWGVYMTLIKAMALFH